MKEQPSGRMGCEINNDLKCFNSSLRARKIGAKWQSRPAVKVR